MVGALKRLSVTIFGFSDAGASVRAGIQKCPDRTIVLSNQNNRVDTELCREIISGLWHLVGHPSNVPDFVPHIGILSGKVIPADISVTTD